CIFSGRLFAYISSSTSLAMISMLRGASQFPAMCRGRVQMCLLCLCGISSSGLTDSAASAVAVLVRRPALYRAAGVVLGGWHAGGRIPLGRDPRTAGSSMPQETPRRHRYLSLSGLAAECPRRAMDCADRLLCCNDP